jgi:hypothetical protein
LVIVDRAIAKVKHAVRDRKRKKGGKEMMGGEVKMKSEVRVVPSTTL